MTDSKERPTPRDEAASRAEARALLDGLPQPPRPQQQHPQRSGEPDLVQLTFRAEKVAALSGSLEPRVLLASVGVAIGDAIARGLLNALAPFFQVEVKSGKTLWSLRSEPRAQILEGVDERSLDFGQLPETDEFGTMLRRVLDPTDHLTQAVVDGLDPDKLLALIAATESVPAARKDKPDLGLLRARIARLRLDNAGQTLVKNFVGRRKELARLRAFLAAPLQGDWAGLIVTGVGGAGKSTLLAKFITEVRQRKTTAAVTLDFDRPGIDPRDTAALEIEIARVVGMDYPELEPALGLVREQDWARKLKASAEQTNTFESREMDRSLQSLDAVRDGLLGQISPPAALLLMLDTFEEVTQLKLEQKLISWLAEVADRLRPVPLKIVFSGRLFNTQATLGVRAIDAEALHLDEFTDEFAIELLCREVASSSGSKLQMPEQFARELVADKLIPRRPLELKLVARLYIDSPGEFDELKRDLREGGERLRGLFAGLVYRRILTRMTGATETVKQLAFPGLVLRYVTPELIRNVLAPCLSLSPMDEAVAQQAFNTLSKYSWFAQREATGELRYRRDLRRATLKVARAQEADKTRRIHAAAIDWFSRELYAQPAEVVYHQLMLVDESRIDAAFLRDIKLQAQRVRGDIEDLPQLGEALLLFAAEEPMLPEQIERLPSPYRDEGYRRKGRRSAQAGEYGLAFSMHQRFRGEGGVPADQLEQWEVETLFANARWSDLFGRRPPRLKRPSEWRAFVTDVFIGAMLESVDIGSLYDLEIAPKVLEDLDHHTEAISQTDLSRLAFAITLHRTRPSSGSWDTLLLWHVAERDGKPGLNGQWAGRLGLLKLLGGQRDVWPEVLLGTPISLDPAAHPDLRLLARRLVPSLASTLDGMLGRVASIVHDGVRGRWTARSILAAVNGLAGFAPTCLEGLDLTVPSGRIIVPAGIGALRAFDAVAAIDPEFREPVRFALRDAFADSSEQLRDLLTSVVPFELDDLTPDGFGRELSADVEHALSTQIELIDRCGAMAALLHGARRLRPDAQHLALVATAHTRWRAALRRLFEICDSREPQGEERHEG